MNISNILRVALVGTLSLSLGSGTIGSLYASQIGTGTVVGSGGLTTSILWNDTLI